MKKFLFLGLCGLMAAGITGCKDDVISDGGNSMADVGGETGYLSFRIKSADTGTMTRAWNDDNGHFAPGDPAEGTYDSFAGEDDIVPNVQANRAFFFHKKDGQLVYHSSSLLNLEGQENGSHDANHDNLYPETLYSTTVKKTSDRGDENWPTQVLIVLNGRPSRLNALMVKAQEDDSFTMEKFLEWINEDLRDTDASGEGLTLGLYTYNGKYYFTMTNSVYLEKDEDASSKLDATEIDTDHLHMTREEAAADPITVYVERIMAKVEVAFTGYSGADTGTTGYITEGNSSLGFLYDFQDTEEAKAKWADDEDNVDPEKEEKLQALITNWTINAVEYQTYLFKQLDQTWAGTTPFDGWNDFNHHRSYWAKDSHYEWNSEEYPTQYRKAFDGKATSYQEAINGGWAYGKETAEENGNDIFDPSYKWALDYKSFDAIKTKRKYKYCLENTFGYGTTIPNYQHMIMGSHLLIQGRLLTSTEASELEGKSEIAEGAISDKYYYSDSYYSESTYINSRATRMAQILGENVGDLSIDNLKLWEGDGDTEDKFQFKNIAGGLWIKEEDGKYKKVVAKVNEKNEDNEIAATDVFVIAPAYVLKGDGKVTIALGSKNEKGEITYGYNSKNVNLYYLEENKVNNGQPATDPVQFTRNQLVSLIYQVAGVADCFKEGMMYYAVPIQHYLAKGGDYDYNYGSADSPLKAGDYGVVRNHWYKFTINTIQKPGIPVHDPNQPIIPNYDETDRYIGLQVIILPWHIVDNGNVNLGENK